MKKILFILLLLPVLSQAQYVKRANSVYNELTVFPNLTVTNVLVSGNFATTSLLPNPDTLRANSLSVGGRYHFDLLCQLTTPLVSIPTLTVRVSLGANTMVLSNGLSLVGSMTAVPFRVVGDIWVVSSTQIIMNAWFTQSNGTVINVTQSGMTPLGTYTVNMATDQLFNITAQYGGISLGNASLTSKVFNRQIYQ